MAGDPGLMFTLYFPIIFALNSKVGIKFIGSVILCEWMNQVSLKVAIGLRLLEMNYNFNRILPIFLIIKYRQFCIIGTKMDATWRTPLLVG